MKKGFKILGAAAGIAALAALVPYSVIKDDEDKTTVQALLWKYTNEPDAETPGNRKVAIDIGFHNPFKAENDHLLMDEDDDLLLVDTPECGIELTLEPKLDDEPEAPAQPEI